MGFWGLVSLVSFRWLRRALDAVLRLFRRRVGDATSAARRRRGGVMDEETQAAVFEAVSEARRMAWAATVAFLRGSARDLGADEAYVPGVPEYAPAATKAAIRRIPNPAGDGWPRVQRALERHVLTASRQTVVSAVEEAPGVAEILDDLSELEKDLGDWPAEDREAIVESVREHENRPRRKNALEDVLDAISERVDQAIRDLDEAGLDDEESDRALENPEPGDDERRDRKGRRILRPFAWARVVRPTQTGPCGFCAMLASRGPVYSSERAAGAGANTFHDGCRCEIVPVFTSRVWEGKADHAKYAQLYKDVVTSVGLTGADARTAMDNALRGNRSADKSEARRKRKEKA